MRINAQRGIVDEDVAVHLADIHAADLSGGDGLDGRLQRQGQAQILGEVIKSSQRQHAERCSRPRQGAGDGAHGPVAPAGDDDIGETGSLAGAPSQFRPFERQYLCVHARSLEGGADVADQILRRFRGTAAGGLVEQDKSSHPVSPGNFLSWAAPCAPARSLRR